MSNNTEVYFEYLLVVNINSSDAVIVADVTIEDLVSGTKLSRAKSKDYTKKKSTPKNVECS